MRSFRFEPRLACRAGRGFILLVSTAVFTGAAPVPACAADFIVKIENMKFDPPHLDVHVGDTITWENHDIFPHTVTSEKGKKPRVDSGTILAGKTFRLKVPKGRSLDYVCRFHPVMKGSIAITE